jgi:GDP-L-fucose synthase
MKTKINISKNSKILITGGNGFLGQYLVAEFRRKTPARLYTPTSKEYDFRNRTACRKAVSGMDIVVHLAAKVGGIGYNREHPAEMFHDNIMMGVQLLDEAWKAGVKKFVALGTICCYPKFTPVPFKEEDLWNGYPEETNAPYGLAKKMLLVQAQAYRTQYKFNAIFILPVNMYGPGDNFNPDSSHVIPALVKKFVDARKHGDSEVVVWGTGKATREFLYVEDSARAIVAATRYYDRPEPVNIGAGFEISIRELAEKIRKISGFRGKLVWDKTKPDGQPRRMLNTTKAQKEFGFTAKTSFDLGLKKTVAYYEKTSASV